VSETCEVCGAPAISSVSDCRELQPEKDEHGRLWSRWELVGPVHHYCAMHLTPPRREYLPGTTKEQITAMEWAESYARILARVLNKTNARTS
jgi:hypothetical protein